MINHHGNTVLEDKKYSRVWLYLQTGLDKLEDVLGQHAFPQSICCLGFLFVILKRL